MHRLSKSAIGWGGLQDDPCSMASMAIDLGRASLDPRKRRGRALVVHLGVNELHDHDIAPKNQHENG